jgi:SAM-dependent methyltransferase
MAERDQARESLRQWSMVAPTWEASRDRLFENLRSVSEWLVDHVRPEAGQTILELTAGPGETGFLVASRLGPSGRLISSDFAPAMVDAARRGASARGLDNVDCRVIDATDIDLPDDSVDGVLSRFGLMLIPAQEQAMREIRRVLRPAGRCAYATWGPPERNPWLFQMVAALLQHEWTPPGDPAAPGGVFSLPTGDHNRALAAGAGFADVTVEELEGVMRFEDPDDYWTMSTSVAGPVAEFVASLGDSQLDAIRATLDPSLAPFQREGGIGLPWLAIATSVA